MQRGILGAQRFLIDEAFQECRRAVAAKGEYLASELPCIRLPFDLCWFEYTKPREDGSMLHGFLAYTDTYLGRDAISFRSVVRVDGRVVLHNGAHGFVLDPHGAASASVRSNGLDERLSYRFAADGFAVLFALALLNSANRVTRDVVTPSRIQERRERSGQLPRVTMTEVLLPAPPSSSRASASGGQRALPLHWVRGHFKRIGEGQYVWWRPHLRGSAERGRRNHTYRIGP